MPASTTFELTGRVVENEPPGRPIPSAIVVIGDGPNAGHSTMSDSSGSFRFTDLAQSGFTVTASADNYFPQSRGVTLTSSQTLTFQLNRFVSRIPPTRFVMSGTAMDDSGRPRPNARINVDFLSSDVPFTYFSHASAVTDGAGAYRVQFDAVPGLMSHHMTAWACLFPGSGYASDCQWIVATAPDISQNFHTYSIPRLPVGQSTTVTVSPGDSLCLNNVQDTPGLLDYVCRTMRVVSAMDGLVTIEAVSNDGGVHPPLEVELLVESGPCCSERLQNPTTIAAPAGVEITVNVEMLWGSATAQTFVLTSKVEQP
jgi:carboxypeptidase family protein